LINRHAGRLRRQAGGNGDPRECRLCTDGTIVIGENRPARDGCEAIVRILTVESDLNVAEGLAQGLRRHAHEVRTVADGISALRHFRWAQLVLLEVELPDIDGVAICREIRDSGETQIIIVTSRGAEVDRVLGLQAGSDDYVVKPYSFPELMARIDAVMRRALQSPVLPKQAIVHGTLHIDPIAREIRVDDRIVRVTRKEFDLLHFLASRPLEVISRHQIMSEVWDDDSCTASSGRTIDTHVNTLRKKLGACGWIVTVRGVGFRMGSASSVSSVPLSLVTPLSSAAHSHGEA
jgi:DNA-binding response OmpR family regulator